MGKPAANRPRRRSMSESSLSRAKRYAAFDRRVGPWMLGLSIVFVVVFVLAFIPGLPRHLRDLCDEIGWLIWGLFVLEFFLRLSLAPDRARALRAHLFDLLVLTMPFMRIFRGVRALRGLARALFAVGGLTLSGRALDSTRRVARSKGVPYVLALVAMATLAGALIIFQV